MDSLMRGSFAAASFGFYDNESFNDSSLKIIEAYMTPEERSFLYNSSLDDYDTYFHMYSYLAMKRAITPGESQCFLGRSIQQGMRLGLEVTCAFTHTDDFILLNYDITRKDEALKSKSELVREASNVGVEVLELSSWLTPSKVIEVMAHLSVVRSA